MRFFILLILFLFQNIFTYSQSTNKLVYIYGKVENYENEVQVEDMSELSELQFPNLERTFIPDSTGRFAISFILDKSNYFRIGRNILFLRPGDSLYAEIDFNRPSDAIFKGEASHENRYLKTTPYPKAGSFLESGDNIRGTIQETIDTILFVAANRKKLLKSYEPKVSKEFIILEYARLNCDIINSLLQIEVYYPYVHKIQKDSLQVFRNNLFQQINPYLIKYSKNLLNSDYLKITVYRQILNTVLKNSGKSEIPDRIRDWQQSKDLMKRISQIKKTDESVFLKSQLAKIKSHRYRDHLLIALEEVEKLNNGAEAVNFAASDLMNKEVNLTDFKGKIIYIKIWATWCEPCITEFAAYDQLRNEYKDNPDIVFISLSIDENPLRWKKFLEARSLKGYEWRISRTLLTQYRVVEIPRNIIIGKDFKIEALFGLPPSNTKIQGFLDGLL